MKARVKVLISYFLVMTLACGVQFFGLKIEKAKAAAITDEAVTASSSKPLDTGVSYTVTFTLPTTQYLQSVKYIFRRSDTDSSMPANLSFGSNMGISHNLGTAFAASYSNGIVSLATPNLYGGNPPLTELAANTSVTMTITDGINPELDDCAIQGQYNDTCYIGVESYAYIPEHQEGEETIPAQSNVLTDSGIASFDLTDTPFFTFSIAGVSSGSTNNDITTTKDSDFDSIDYGTLDYGTPSYAAHKITIQTNSPNGYSVGVRLDGGVLQGISPANNIVPFLPNGETGWANPTAWVHPTGSTPNEDTGWFGANTTDARVTGWLGAEGKFGPISNSFHDVAVQDIRNRGEKIVYVTYAIEVNNMQPADLYAGTLEYSVTSKY